MERLVISAQRLRGIGIVAALLLLGGCPAAERKADTPQASQAQTPQSSEKEQTLAKEKENEQAKAQSQQSPAEPAAEVPPKAQAELAAPSAAAEKPATEGQATPHDEEVAPPIDLGPPLVDNVDKLVKLDPDRPTWLDAAGKRVVLVGQVSRPDYLLEFFATLGDRGYESVVVVDVKASLVHAALLALGARPGHPVQFTPEFIPASGSEVDVDVAWKDKDGKRQQAKAQDWIRNVQTKKALDANWVFAGSGFYKDESTGREYYQADGGDFISVLNLPTAMLDLPIRSVSGLESRQFEIFTEHVPPRGTPVTIILTPKRDKAEPTDAAAKSIPEAAEKSEAAPTP